MSEIDMNRINAEIEEQIKMCASNTVFQWHGRTFYCCDVEPTEDSHVGICHSLDLHGDFPLQIGREIETFKHERLEPQNASETQMPEWPWVRRDSV
jgi:hypothetical protein